MNGAPLEETNATGGWLRDYIFFNGQRIAARTPTAGLLGSGRRPAAADV